MPTRRPSSTAETPDLRQRILDTSRALLESDGVAGLSMREVARRAGVTHQAPYHHFGDRESILAELVSRGFEDLARRLAEANDILARAGQRDTLIASCAAYVGFAIEQPGVFRIMFRPDMCDPARFPAARAAGERAHAELHRLVRLIHGDAASDTLASVYWAHVHGLACLIVDGPLGLQWPEREDRMRLVAAAGRQFADFVLAPHNPRETAAISYHPQSTLSKGE